ncbi:MAG: fructose-6-phosphate aldolase [Actinobacteria bacterium]|nr:fructose-6-phosphate aldolase [Actinomycetota bacterium]
MKFFIDTASLDDITTIAGWGVLSGATTNPTLLGQVPGEPDDIYRHICELVGGPVSAEVVAEARDAMVTEGTRLAAIHPNIVVKLPMSPEALSATSTLATKGIRVNMTLVFTAPQAMMAAASGAAYVSPFIGRYDDIGQDGIGELGTIVDCLASQHECQVLAASIRHPVHVIQAAQLGADVATIPPKVFHQMLQHPLTASGIAKFTADAVARAGNATP